MKKIFISLFAIIICLSLTTGCNSNNEEITNEQNNNINETESKLSSIDDFENEIKKLGINYEKIKMDSSYIGAEEGIKLTSNDKTLEIYKYNDKTDSYKTAENTQKITLTGIGSYDAIVKNGYALLIDNDFPQYDSIIEIFNKLK